MCVHACACVSMRVCVFACVYVCTIIFSRWLWSFGQICRKSSDLGANFRIESTHFLLFFSAAVLLRSFLDIRGIMQLCRCKSLTQTDMWEGFSHDPCSLVKSRFLAFGADLQVETLSFSSRFGWRFIHLSVNCQLMTWSSQKTSPAPANINHL